MYRALTPWAMQIQFSMQSGQKNDEEGEKPQLIIFALANRDMRHLILILVVTIKHGKDTTALFWNIARWKNSCSNMPHERGIKIGGIHLFSLHVLSFQKRCHQSIDRQKGLEAHFLKCAMLRKANGDWTT